MYLLIASLVWAFSFGLVKHVLVQPGVDPVIVGVVRIALSLALFLPFLRRAGLDRRLAFALMRLGAVQYGLMYLCYLESYRYLPAHQVALFTITTPLLVVLLHDLFAVRLHRVAALAALLAVAGAGLVAWREGGLSGGWWKGFGFVQLSNVCFAYGQVRYRAVMGGRDVADRSVFALLYLGGLLVTLLMLPGRGVVAALESLTPRQALTLLYLGLVPSGLCFFLWNYGARRSAAGFLAVMNNAKVPLAVVVALCVWSEPASLWRLAAGGAAMALAVWLTQRHGRERAPA